MANELKLATWNVNSLKVRLPQVLDWLGTHAVDIVCLQETKLTDDRFPVAELQAAGYHCYYAGQKTYNGVAILLRQERVGAAQAIQINLPEFEDEQRRLLALTVDGVRVVCAYVPNGQAVDSDKYHYKLKWLSALTRWLGAQLQEHPRLALAGDFNIAPQAQDVYDPQAWAGQILCSDQERAAFAGLLDLGLHDAFRLFPQVERSYTWWDYRQLSFRRKLGLRIDHVLLSNALATECARCWIDVEPRKREQPSDHAPVIVELQADSTARAPAP